MNSYLGEPAMKFCLIMLVFSLGACSTLTKSQCKAGKWTEIGLADSKNNRDEDFYNKHIEACDSGDFKEDEYKKGWAMGLPARAALTASQENPELYPPTAEQVATESENYKQVKALAIGSVVGLGTGHMLQDRYSERGWLYTLLEGSVLLVPVKGWVLLGFLGVKAYEIVDLSKYFYSYRLSYPN
jgi:hypothetical protein